MNTEDNEELIARVRRTETRLHRLCQHIGMPDTPTPPTAARKDAGHIVVKVQGHDVVVSAIKRSLETAGLPLDETVSVVTTAGEHVCYIRVQ